jgi:hypothetical protein
LHEVSFDVASSKKASASGDTGFRFEIAIATELALPIFGNGIASNSVSADAMILTGLGRTEAHFPVLT